MDTLSELLKKLRSLPLGNVYKKNINGKTYYYHQYFINGKRICNLVKEDKLDELTSEINERKEIEKRIKSIKLRNTDLSVKANELSGYVMSGNVVTAEFEKGNLVSLNENLAPLVIKRTKSLEKFLKLRIIDMSRTNARILKKVLNINVDEDYKVSLYSYALSVSDNYWFKPKHSKLKYLDVNFNNDAFFETSLKGEIPGFFNRPKLSPEITTPGSFEKGWRYIDNEWWLYKTGNDKQILSELFSCRFAKLIGIDTIIYEEDSGFIKSKNFSSEYNFEPMAALADDNDNYDFIFNILIKINKQIAKDYLKLIFFDSVVNNVDRHNENMGLLRDAETGRIISLAPNFDNNISFVATSNSFNENPKKDGFIKIFVEFLNKNSNALELFKTIELKQISEEDINAIFDEIHIDFPNKNELSKTVLNRYNYLKNLF